MAGKRKKKRSPQEIASGVRAVKDLREERQDLMRDLTQLNETLERQNIEWLKTINALRRSKALLLDEIGRVAAKIREVGHAEA